MAVERMMPGDVELLTLIIQKDRKGALSSPETEPHLFRDMKVAALIHRLEVRIASIGGRTSTSAS